MQERLTPKLLLMTSILLLDKHIHTNITVLIRELEKNLSISIILNKM
jgi:hypothetical protein